LLQIKNVHDKMDKLLADLKAKKITLSQYETDFEDLYDELVEIMDRDAEHAEAQRKENPDY